MEKEKAEEVEKAMQLLRRLAGEDGPADAAAGAEAGGGEQVKSKAKKPKARAGRTSKARGVAAVEEAEAAGRSRRAAAGEAGPSSTSDDEDDITDISEASGGGPTVASGASGGGVDQIASKPEDVKKPGPSVPVKKRRATKSKASERGVASAVSE